MNGRNIIRSTLSAGNILLAIMLVTLIAMFFDEISPRARRKGINQHFGLMLKILGIILDLSLFAILNIIKIAERNTHTYTLQILEKNQRRGIPFSQRLEAIGITDNYPQKFICPISCVLINDPVVANDGRLYDRKSLEAYFQKHDNHIVLSSPFTPDNPGHTVMKILRPDLTPTYISARDEIEEYVKGEEKRIRMRHSVLFKPVHAELVNKLLLLEDEKEYATALMPD